MGLASLGARLLGAAVPLFTAGVRELVAIGYPDSEKSSFIPFLMTSIREGLDLLFRGYSVQEKIRNRIGIAE